MLTACLSAGWVISNAVRAPVAAAAQAGMDDHVHQPGEPHAVGDRARARQNLRVARIARDHPSGRCQLRARQLVLAEPSGPVLPLQQLRDLSGVLGVRCHAQLALVGSALEHRLLGVRFL